MKTLLTTLSIIVFNLCINAQQTTSIISGKKEIIHSKILNENRTIWVYTPNLTNPNIDSLKKYPVLYLLDGESHFFSTVGILQQLSQANGNGILPEMIIVGIENTNRMRDLVPASDENGSNKFLQFISEELIPYVNLNYKAAPYKSIFGHSLGGLTVIDILTNSPNTFDSYIAVDPSMWYQNEFYLKRTLDKIGKSELKRKKLFVATANTLPKKLSFSKLKKDKSPETQHIRSILRLDNYLKNIKNGLDYQQKYYEFESHNSLPLIGEYDALRFIFNYYQFESNENDFKDSTTLIATKLKNHYSKVSQNMGYKNAAPEAFINYLGYEALNKKHYDKARALFELNIEWYPDRNNVYDSYGDYFLSIKDTVNAIKNYQKSLQINSNVESQRKLELLTSTKNTTISKIDLSKYVGVYILENYNIPIEILLRESRLFAKVPGQNEDEFELVDENVFTVKGKQGYKITFYMEENKPIRFTSVQPNGVFTAVYTGK